MPITAKGSRSLDEHRDEHPTDEGQRPNQIAGECGEHGGRAASARSGEREVATKRQPAARQAILVPRLRAPAASYVSGLFECQPMTRPPLQNQWHEVLIDGYALAGCVIVFAYLVWQLVAAK